ncbi:hypothetical protein [Streptomyces muensis]|uniref:Uncharacterized protein n=1 Tax=Streptomyces muensis TaxID=1077944 RepID=A0A9X1PUT8_STRM4|nr:hypothetical protein [Streptomyces muensis]MCF1592910.1 hypothetical protein [Streptomyces muensis]
MSVSVLTEHANRSRTLAGLPLRADRAQQMSQLAPVLATPATAVAFAAGVGVGLALGQAHAAGMAACGTGNKER